ncbi:MAG: DUF6427 family protein [Bacteroidota bacterium]
MLIRFFKNNSPSSFILLPAFALLLWGSAFWGQQAGVTYSMPLYDLLMKPLGDNIIGTIVAFLLIVGEAFLLNYIVNENEILNKPSFLPALLYIVFMSSEAAQLVFSPILFANFFIIMAIFKLVSSYRKDIAFSNAFDAGILLSIATLFYFPCVVFLPLLGIGFILFRPFNWHEWVISSIGVLVPYLFVFTYYFWNDKLGYWWNADAFFPGIRERTGLVVTPAFYFMAGICMLIILVSFGKLFTGFLDATQKNKKGIVLLLWFTAFALISIVIAPEFSFRSFSIFSIPMSVFCANYFLKIKKAWFGELLFMLLLLSIIINRVAG